MAVEFDDSVPQYLEKDNAQITATPFTMACWFWSDDATINQCLIGLANRSATDQVFMLQAAGNLTGDPVRAFVRSGSAPHTDARTTTGYSVNTWHHACGVFASSADVRAFIDGGSKGTHSANRVPNGIDRTSIGRLGDSTPGAYMSGKIAEAAIWDTALSDEEVASLAAGFAPPLVRRRNLKHYYRLLRLPPFDVMRTDTISAFGNPIVVTHPRIIYPTDTRMVGWLPAAAGVNPLDFERKYRGVMRGNFRGAA